jgi:hypothetical protein
MRRTISSIAFAALVVFAGLIPATAASAGDAPRVRYYEGPTSAGGRLHIRVVVKDGVPYVTLLSIDGPYRCEDGTRGELVDDGVGWGDSLAPAINDARLELSENWHVVAFMVSGRLGSHQGSGTLTFLMPGFTADRQAAQVCTTGELTWSVERTSGEDFPFIPAVRVKSRGQGTLMGLGQSSSEGTALAPTEASPIRHYRGRTSQELYMAAQTQPTDSRIAMRGLSVGYLLTCEDDIENEGGIRPLAFFDSTQVMPPQRLDVDLEPSSRAGTGLGLEPPRRARRPRWLRDANDHLARTHGRPWGAAVHIRRPDMGSVANGSQVLSDSERE